MDISDQLYSQVAFIGHTRFSVHQHGSGNFVATRKGERGAGFNNEEYTEWLYSRNRMQPRMEIFARFGVPQLALAARDYNVVHYVSYSPSLPEEYKTTLHEISDANDFIQLNQVEGPIGPLPSTSMIKVALTSLGLAENLPIGAYRLDDDDVLAADYFARMAPYVRPEFSGFWASLGLGVAALQSGEDLVYGREWYFPKIAIGLMHVIIPDFSRPQDVISKVNHRLVDFDAPTILDSREPGWFHVRHPGQDTNLANRADAFFPQNFRKISGRGPVQPRHLFKLFPVLASCVHASPGDPTQARALVQEPFTCRGKSPRFSLETSGPLAVSVITDSRGGLPNVKLHFTLHNQGSTETVEFQRFIKRQGAKYSHETSSYFVGFISEQSSSEHVAVLEFPSDVCVSEVWLASGGLSTFDIASIMVYQL